MKSIIIALFLVGSVFAQPKMGGPCGPPPTKMPNECCDSIDKLMKPDIYNNCKSQCGMDRCCEGECFAKGLNFLKDGKYDKATATSSVNKAFAANPEWLPVATKAINDCETDAGSMKSPPGPPCANPEIGSKVFCIKKKMFTNCPKPSSDAECEKTRAFFNCI